MKLAYVKWFDSVYLGGAHMKESEIDGKPIIMESVGFLVKETKDSVVLSTDTCADEGTFRHVHLVARANIIEVRTADPADMRKRNRKR